MALNIGVAFSVIKSSPIWRLVMSSGLGGPHMQVFVGSSPPHPLFQEADLQQPQQMLAGVGTGGKAY